MRPGDEVEFSFRGECLQVVGSEVLVRGAYFPKDNGVYVEFWVPEEELWLIGEHALSQPIWMWSATSPLQVRMRHVLLRQLGNEATFQDALDWCDRYQSSSDEDDLEHRLAPLLHLRSWGARCHQEMVMLLREKRG